jgi:bifunctional UDP-N-acetylglucosamine pyrophosphorylase/glucosamine-1-phosphate N-acetyltransferase
MDIPVTVLILAAGLGTRMKSKKAKVLHRAGGMALIEHATDAALKLAPPERVFIVVGHQADEVMAAVGDRGVRFVQQAEPKGTGHAVMAAREALERAGGLLLVLYGDAPLLTAETLLRLVTRQQQGDVAATVLTAMLDDPAGYGRILRDEHGRVRAIVEQKAATPAQLAVREINSGTYCFDSGLLWKHIGAIKAENPAKEYYLTDIVGILHGKGHAIAPLLREDPQELLGINTRAELAAVDRIFRDRTVQRLMLEGVTIEKPETVTIDSSVSIGMDTVIEPFAQVLGRSTIGEDCVIGACSIIRGSQLGDGVVVEPFTLVLDSAFESGARVGPFARVRMDSHVGREARVGNFVELKKARLGAGAKSLHLAYLGDTEIGEEANVGAGTITCNYDGLRKYRTKIGRGVFVGSNATLVAPVVIGDGSYIGAGSVVTENVPEDALALGRARQVNKPEWAKKRRERKLRPDTLG